MSETALNQALLQAAVDALPTDDLSAMRRAAVASFAQMGFPTLGQEDWKYTSLATTAELSNAWLGSLPLGGKAAATDRTEELIASVRDSIDAHWLVVRDGFADSGAAAIGEAGIRISGISADESLHPGSDDPMSVFNAALLRDGLKFSIAANAVPKKPVGILFIDDPSNAVAQTRVIVDVGADARLQLIECSLSAGPGRQFTNAVTGIELARGARLDHVRIQNRDHAHTGVSRISASLDRDACLFSNNFDLGGALTRNDIVIGINGPGASVNLTGLYLADDKQHIDNHTSILHNIGPAISAEEYRGIMAGRSQCVFNGKVVVAKGADGTDSSQTNHNLLLSERAEIDTKPELEIYADDVKCAHGATVGQLDEGAIFYLRSRGLALAQARQLLTRAFAAGTLGTLSIGECHDFLTRLLDQRLESLVGGQSCPT